MFNSDRLTLARQRRSLTKKQLAEHAGTTPRAITAFESGEYPPAEDTLLHLARVLDFPEHFFYKDAVDIIEEDTVSFRSLKRMTAAQKKAAISAGALAVEINDWLNHRFKLPEPEIPDLRGEAPEEAAKIVRSEWGLGHYSIKNMVHLMEAKGVRVFSLFENAREVDAFSAWKGSTPFIFSNQIKTVAHRRFDIAHELGHLVLHKHGAPAGPEAEKEADMFAAEFLMPADTVKNVATGLETVERLVQMKEKWKVSVAALARRLRDTGMASEWHYRTLCIRISQLGYRTREPNDYAPERSMVWEKVMASLRSTGGGVYQISEELHLPTSEVEKLVWGLTTMALTPNKGPIFQSDKKPVLRLVK
ncbi:XRE family transcriptional regulator [Acetobacter indonesiensis]|uniref:helix-turn-helix domain-containing protein n=1 Tax=Acetobacter indonesiensis TaxID=104101 RepID=UPI001F3CB444|nr:XRE family transcriptional regulator [Acetobacter indonesiensis]MCG0994849.1 XRE family transcriptional regulator [Acetobacter indonesiensis]